MNATPETTNDPSQTAQKKLVMSIKDLPVLLRYEFTSSGGECSSSCLTHGSLQQDDAVVGWELADRVCGLSCLDVQ